MTRYAVRPLPADLAAVQRAKEYKRFNFFGFRFGPSKVKGLRLVADPASGALNAQVKIGRKWKDVGDALLNEIAVRHIDLAVHTAQLGLAPYLPVAAASVPPAATTLRRRGALRRATSAPPILEGTPFAKVVVPARAPSAPSSPRMGQVASARPVLTRATSVASARADLQGVAEPKAAVDPLVKAYCDAMRKPHTYAGDLEIYALEQLFDLTIAVVRDVPDLKNEANPDARVLVVNRAGAAGAAADAAEAAAAAAGADAATAAAAGAAAADAAVAANKATIALLHTGTNKNFSSTSLLHFRPLVGFDAGRLRLNDPAKPEVAAHAAVSLGNGQCLFDSVRQLLPGGTEDAQALRERAVAWLAANPGHKVLGLAVSEHMQQLVDA